MPKALKLPGSRGTRMRPTPREEATAVASVGPMPPKAARVKSAGSKPRSMVMVRMEETTLAARTRSMPRAASSSDMPRGSATARRMAAADDSGSMAISPCSSARGFRWRSCTRASVNVGRSPPLM